MAAEFLDCVEAARKERGLLLAERIWALRQDLTAYDAAYVALAEAPDAPLVTTDRRIASSPGHRAEVQVCGGP